MRKLWLSMMILVLFCSVTAVLGEEMGILESAESVHEGGLGAVLPVWSVVPFVGILLSIAVFPLVAEKFWHHHFGKVAAAWAVIFSVPFLFAHKGEALHEILHIYIADYIPFIILLWALFTVAGGIYLKGSLWGSPVSNTILLLIGTVIASWVGTTGASMLLIRPIIRMNKQRKNKVHIILFFIFLVSNIGGSLTPLGDPPLFLGFLHGVPFFWTLNLFPPMALVSIALLAMFFIFDVIMYRREGLSGKGYGVTDLDVHIDEEHGGMVVVEEVVDEPKTQKHVEHVIKKERLAVDGLINLIFLVGIIAGVLFSGYVKLGEVNILGVHTPIEFVIRDAFLLLMIYLSVRFTDSEIRKGNEFTWFPIKEVGILFAGIFMTIIPALLMLQAGTEGHLAFIVEAVREPTHYFWITGALSSFLDNAPTYLTFFNTALGSIGLTEEQVSEGLLLMNNAAMNHTLSAELLEKMHSFTPLLFAISTSAVFFGANTYIGNAPNFMVRSIAEENGIKMPSFFGYMMYSVLILVPLFLVVALIFF